MISRYDVRIHLDLIPDYSKLPPHEPASEERREEGRCNYERYRSLVQNLYHGTSEPDALSKITVDEMFTGDPRRSGREKKKSQARAAIAFKYDQHEGGGGDSDIESQDERLLAAYLREDQEEREKAFSSESEYEVDMDIDDFVPSQVDKLNVLALDYGVPAGSFSNSLRQEKSLLAQQREARIADIEKTVNAGKHSRRERRQMKDKKGPARLPTPPSYAIRESPSYEPYGDIKSGSSSRSTSPEVVGKVEYITEFGGTEPEKVGVAKQKVGGARSRGRMRMKRWDIEPGDPSLSRKPKKSYRSPSPRSRPRSMRRRSRSRSRSRERRRRHSQRSHAHYSRSRSRSRSRDRRVRQRRSRSGSPVHPKPHSSQLKSRSNSSSSSPERVRSSRKLRSRSRSRSASHSPEIKRTILPPKPPEKKVPLASAMKEKGKVKLTPQEKLKRKMQAQLNKQVKIDKKAQKAKIEQKEAEKVEREEGLREQMKKRRDKEDLERFGRVRRSRSRSPPPAYHEYAHYDQY